MNNREWLNTLSDEEFASQIKHIVMLAMNDTTNAIYQELILEQLQAEHETTADEDANKIGWKIRIVEDEIVLSNWNIIGCDAYYGLKKDGTERVTLLNVSAKPQIDIPIDKIRTIADKKRKEVWG